MEEMLASAFSSSRLTCRCSLVCILYEERLRISAELGRLLFLTLFNTFLCPSSSSQSGASEYISIAVIVISLMSSVSSDADACSNDRACLATYSPARSQDRDRTMGRKATQLPNPFRLGGDTNWDRKFLPFLLPVHCCIYMLC